MKPSWIACWVTEKAPEITAWLAMIVADRGEDDQRQPQRTSGAIRKKGLSPRFGVLRAASRPGPYS